MEQGFVLDQTHGGRGISHWAPGSPKKSIWVGTKKPKASFPVGVFRCESCGYLEAYAREEFAPS